MSHPRKKRRPKRPAEPHSHSLRYHRLAILTALDRLLVRAADPAFRGAVEVRVDAANGRLAEPRFTTVQYGTD